MTAGISHDELLSLAGRYGTPLYVYDGDLIVKRYRELFEFFPWQDLKIFYAMKANYNFHILRLLKSVNSHIDAVSPGDVLLAMRAGFASGDLLYTANNITLDEMSLIQGLGVLQNIESLSALERFGKTFPGSEVCLRFNPDVVAGEHRYVATGGEESKFGISLKDVKRASDVVRKYSLKVAGLHEHTGSGISDKSKVMKSMENLLSIATMSNFPDLRFVDFGGGLKVPYAPHEERVDYGAFGEKVVAMFSRYCDDYGRKLSLCFEPGKYIVAESGYLLVEVNTIREKKDHLIAGVNSGFSQLIRPVFYDAYHHILNLSNPEGELKVYDIYGNICESGDYFARKRELPRISEGDILAVLTAGAYCYSMGSVYNLRPMPSEVLIADDHEILASKGLSYEGMVSRIISMSDQLELS